MVQGESETPRVGRVLAIDYGHVRLGLAISDPDQTLASPFENYTRRSPAKDAAYLRQVTSEERVALIVVGLPVHLSGQESQKSFEAREFADWVKQQTGVPVVLFDERFTTHEAEQHLLAAGLTKQKRKARLDMLAAQALLKGYLDSDRSARHDRPGGLG